jgi:hypothetical protein
VLLAPTLIYVAMLRLNAQPRSEFDYGPIWSGYLGILLVGALFIAIGLFCSSLTRSQVVAAVTPPPFCSSSRSSPGGPAPKRRCDRSGGRCASRRCSTATSISPRA